MRVDDRGSRTLPAVLAALVVVAVIGAAVAAYRFRHDAQRWEPDAAIYLRMTLADRGASPAAAKADADRFMLTTSEGANPQSRDFYGPATPRFYADQFALFRTRPLFPLAGALLYPRFGPHGLQLISAVAYALLAPLLFGVLLLVARPWIAALGAIAGITAPNVLDLAAYALTDEAALLFWVAALGAILAYQVRPDARWLAAATAASALLAFTRPAVYLPLGAAAGAVFAARDPRARSGALLLLGAIGAVAVVFFVYTLAVHGPGIGEQLGWQYQWQLAIGAIAPGQSFAAWYVRAVAGALALVAVLAVYKNGALFALALAGFGAAFGRPRAFVPVLAGAALSLVLPILVNPLEIARTVATPLVPVIAILATAALTLLAERRVAA